VQVSKRRRISRLVRHICFICTVTVDVSPVRPWTRDWGYCSQITCNEICIIRVPSCFFSTGRQDCLPKYGSKTKLLVTCLGLGETDSVYRGVYRLLPKNPKNFHPAAPPFFNQLQLFTHFTYDDETSFIGFALTSSIGSCKQISSTCENCDAAPCSRSGGLPRRN
jgi:hypothetical protein